MFLAANGGVSADQSAVWVGRVWFEGSGALEYAARFGEPEEVWEPAVGAV